MCVRRRLRVWKYHTLFVQQMARRGRCGDWVAGRRRRVAAAFVMHGARLTHTLYIHSCYTFKYTIIRIAYMYTIIVKFVLIPK